MKMICSHCYGDIDEGLSDRTDKVSHGICESCAAHLNKQWGELNLDEYLDMFHYPVLVVNDEAIVLASNRQMDHLLGRNEREQFGMLIGDTMECVYAWVPEGCGQTNHCKACGIRINVAKTFESGEPISRARVSLDREEGRVHFLISTYKMSETVQILFEEVPDSV